MEQITEKGSRGKDWKEDQSTGQNLKTKQLLTKLTESTPKMEIAGQSACHASLKNWSHHPNKEFGMTCHVSVIPAWGRQVRMLPGTCCLASLLNQWALGSLRDPVSKVRCKEIRKSPSIDLWPITHTPPTNPTSLPKIPQQQKWKGAVIVLYTVWRGVIVIALIKCWLAKT